MIKTISKVGNGQALLLDKPILEMLGLREGSRVRLSVNGRTLIVMPVDDGPSDEEVAAAAERAHRKYGKLLKRLA